MLSTDLLDNIKCALLHSCLKVNDATKECAHCDIGYTFIACEPIVLECGHHICKDCKEKCEKDAVNSHLCNICSEQIKCTKTNGKASQSLMKMLFKDLSSELKEKFLKAIDILNDSSQEYETRAKSKMHKLKNQVDLRVEMLKFQIDAAANELHEEIDSYFDKNFKFPCNKYLNERAKELKENLLNTQEQFDAYQKDLNEAIDRIQKCKDAIINIELSAFDSTLNAKKLLGELNFDNQAKFQSKIEDQTIEKSQILDENNAQVTIEQKAKSVLVSAGNDGTLKIWDIENERCIRTLTEHNGGVAFIKNIGNGLLASPSRDRTIKIWNMNRNVCEATLRGHLHGVTCVELIGEDLLASGSADNSIKIWDLKSKTVKFTLARAHESDIWCLLSMKPNLFASSSSDCTIKVWNLKKQKCMYVLVSHEFAVSAMKLLRPNLMISSGMDGKLKLWNLKRRVLEKTFVVDSAIHSMAVLDDNNTVVCGCLFGIRVFDLEKGEVRFFLSTLVDRTWCFARLSENRLASGGDDGLIKIWDMKTGLVKSIQSNQNGLMGLALFDIN